MPENYITRKSAIFQENIKSRASLTKSIMPILKLKYLSKFASRNCAMTGGFSGEF